MGHTSIMLRALRDIRSEIFIEKYAFHLHKQGKIKVPHFCEHAKMASSKELVPLNPDWWYTRLSAITRKVYLKQGLGVGHFRNIYGSSRRKGTKPAHHSRASGNIIRKCLQQL